MSEPINKEKWPRGPWDDEPDEERFTHMGIECLILRFPITGTLSGYVRVSDEMRAKFQTMNDEPANFNFEANIGCHGGVTHTGELQDREGYWVGFDTAHAGDYMPALTGNTFLNNLQYRDIEYIREQVKSMVVQLLKAIHWAMN